MPGNDFGEFMKEDSMPGLTQYEVRELLRLFARLGPMIEQEILNEEPNNGTFTRDGLREELTAMCSGRAGALITKSPNGRYGLTELGSYLVPRPR